jgi:hypothetical protein
MMRFFWFFSFECAAVCATSQALTRGIVLGISICGDLAFLYLVVISFYCFVFFKRTHHNPHVCRAFVIDRLPLVFVVSCHSPKHHLSVASPARQRGL